MIVILSHSLLLWVGGIWLCFDVRALQRGQWLCSAFCWCDARAVPGFVLPVRRLRHSVRALLWHPQASARDQWLCVTLRLLGSGR